MKKLILIFLFVLAFSVGGFATPQMGDIVFYKGIECLTYVYPLEVYFKEYPDARPKSNMSYSDLERGYRAIFEVESGQLYIMEIGKPVTTKINDGELCYVDVRGEVFPKMKKVKVDWFTGLLVLAYGKVVDYNFCSSETTVHENYVLLEFDKGSLVKETPMFNEEYQEFKRVNSIII